MVIVNVVFLRIIQYVLHRRDLSLDHLLRFVPVYAFRSLSTEVTSRHNRLIPNTLLPVETFVTSHFSLGHERPFRDHLFLLLFEISHLMHILVLMDTVRVTI